MGYIIGRSDQKMSWKPSLATGQNLAPLPWRNPLFRLSNRLANQKQKWLLPVLKTPETTEPEAPSEPEVPVAPETPAVPEIPSIPEESVEVPATNDELEDPTVPEDNDLVKPEESEDATSLAPEDETADNSQDDPAEASEAQPQEETAIPAEE